MDLVDTWTDVRYWSSFVQYHPKPHHLEVKIIDFFFTFRMVMFYVKDFKNLSLRKRAYSNILKILPPKNENFQIKNSDIFQDSAQNIDMF